METDPNPNNLADSNELVSVKTPKSLKEIPGLLMALLAVYYPPGFLKKVLAEVIATYLLVFVTCGSAALSTSNEQRVSKLGASVAGGLIVTVMIYAVGHISGAHMNPAVTLAFAAVRRIPWKQVPVYAASQLTGAISAAYTLRLLLHPIKNLGTTTPMGTEIQALVMEIVVTFSMMFIASAVATDTVGGDWFERLGLCGVSPQIQIGELAGLAVGSAVCITSILAGPVSGGSMNPARTIGPALASATYKGIWVYVAGPVIGTLRGAYTYNLIRESDKPVHAISQQSLSFKLCRIRSNDREFVNKNTLQTV